MRKLNLKLLLKLMLGILLTGGVAFGVHEFQVKHSAQVLLDRAAAAYEEHRSAEAMEMYLRYHGFVSKGSGDSLGRLGLLQADARRYPPAARNLEMALVDFPDRDDFRRRLVEVQLSMGRYSDARRHVTRMVEAAEKAREKAVEAGDQSATANIDEDRDRLYRWLGQCQVGIGDYDGAVVSFEKACEANPARLETYMDLAVLLSTDKMLNDLEQAMNVLDQMVASNLQSCRAYAIRGTQRLRVATNEIRQTGASRLNVKLKRDTPPESRPATLETATEDAKRALELCPEDDASLILMVNCLIKANRLNEARDVAVRGLELHSANVLMYRLMADIELQLQNRLGAIDWLRKGLGVAPSNTDLQWNLTQLLIEEGRVEEADELIPRLSASKYPPAPIEYLKARILMGRRDGKEDFVAASRLLERIRPSLVPWPDLGKQADLRLGECYQRMGQHDLQLVAYRRASGLDPTWIPARLGVAEALFATNDISRALEEYEQIARLKAPDPLRAAVLLNQSRLLIYAAQRGTDESARYWQMAAAALDSLERIDPGTPQLATLRAEVAFGRGDRQKAEEMLRAAYQRSPKTLEFRLGLAALAERRGEFDEGERYLNEAETELGDSVDLRLARARNLQSRRDPGIKERLRKLTEGVDSFGDDDRVRLYRAIAAITLSLKDWDETERLLRIVATERKSLLLVRLELFELAMLSQRTSTIDELLKEIERIEGGRALSHYASAVYAYVLALQARDKKDQNELARQCSIARTHLEVAGPQRPEWARVPRLLAEVAELQQDEPTAMTQFVKAIELGDRDARVLSHTMVLLYRYRKFDEAKELLSRLRSQGVAFTNDMVRMSVEISLAANDNKGALEWTSQFAQSSSDSNELLWLGQKQWILRRYDEAERNFRKAIAIDEAAPDPHVAFIVSLSQRLPELRHELAVAQANRQLAAEAARLAADLENLELKIKGEIEAASRKVSPEKVPLMLARCQEAYGDVEQAEARYQEVVKAAPSDSTGLRWMAEFYRRQGRFQDAAVYFDRLVAPTGKASREERHRARRDLAMTLTSCRDQASVDRGQSLIRENLQDEKLASIEDRRTQAIMLAMLPGRASQRAAAKALEDVIVQTRAKKLEPLPEDLFLLAQIYVNLQDGVQAEKRMRDLISHGGSKVEPRYLATYIDFLLSRNDVEEAELWTRQLEKKAPSDFGTIALRAKLLVRRGQFERVLPHIERFLQDPSAEVLDRQVRRRACAPLLEQLARQMTQPPKDGSPAAPQADETSGKLMARAEELLTGDNDDNPREFVALATFFNRQGKHGRSLDLLEQRWSQVTPEEISVVASALLTSTTTADEEFDRAEKVLELSMEKYSRAVPLLLALADIRNWRKDYEGAERLYREVLQKDPRNAVAMNNLALLLALQRVKLDESVALIGEAIRIVGPDPSLIDTRATILLERGEAEQAAKDLGLVLEIRPSGLAYFHQAEVRKKLGQKEGARDSLVKAKENGIVVMSLHPIERKKFNDLDEELR